MNNNIEKLKKFLIEKGIDEKELNSYLFDIEKDLKDKKYGLVWEEKEEEVAKLLKNKYPVLKEITEREIKTDINKPTNLLIEGDNLLALNSLLATHKNSVNICYIDPPYNTGNKDFKYNDKFVDKEDSWKHSQWLSFMNKRLELVKELLTDDGVIFISIDNNENAQLKLLCDEIFGENNFQANISYVRKTSGKQDSSNFVNSTEYILVYTKTNLWKANQIVAGDNVIKRYNKTDEYGKKYREVDLRKTGSNDRREDSPSLYYPFYFNTKTNELFATKNRLSNIDNLIEIFPIKSDGTEGNWRWSCDTANKNIDNLIAKIMPKYKKENKWTIYEKDYIDKKEDIRTIKEHTCWDRTEFNSDNAVKDFVELGFNNKDFSYPKSVDLIKHILYLGNNKNAIVLDFFAGSGTTGHALLNLNKEDGGNRQFILCTNNENNICEEVTYQRLNKVINGYTTPKGKDVEGLGGNLKYYKCDTIDKHSNEEVNNSLLIENMAEMIKIKSNCYEVLGETDDYVIVQCVDKITGIVKNNYVGEDIVNDLSKKLLSYEHKNKELYTNIELESIDIFDSITYFKTPKELMK